MLKQIISSTKTWSVAQGSTPQRGVFSEESLQPPVEYSIQLLEVPLIVLVHH
jgi:hypothetical protein